MKKSYKNYDWYKDYNFLINRKEVIDELVKLKGDEEVIETMELQFNNNLYSDCYINSFLINVWISSI